MKLKSSLIGLSLLSLSTGVWATDLLQSWQAAAKFDAQISAARNAQIAGQEKAEQGQALLLPKVSVTGNTAYSQSASRYGREGGTLHNTDVNGESYGISISAVQPIYRAEAFASADQLKKQTDLANVQYRQAEQDLILRVSKAYFELLAAQEKVTLAQAQKQAVAEQLAFAKKSFEVGVATITDTDEAQASYDSIIAAEILANNDLAVKRSAFTLLTGLNAEQLATIGDQKQPSSPEPNDLSVWLKKAQDNSLSNTSQQLALDIATREIDKYRALSAPTLDLVASYGSDWTGSGLSRSGATDQNMSGAIKLQLAIPFYTGGDRSSRLREAAAKKDQQRDNVLATQRDVEQVTKQSFLGVNAGAAQIRALQQVLKSSQSLLASSKLGREVGVRTTIDVLNAEQKYYATRYDLVVARYTYLYARLLLAASAGELTEKDLIAVNEWLVQLK
ncbi:TolC family outer membrane protein [Chitinibacter bivalviorum]|uniref:TolC family outer membrane protein n=1 Tax=Chitinibacter bivalviorum TaxID=2739434 RepID=A0A7H9BND7_9NEIS|nr:TolC family outer membrane protein [Chitinibacter bivalviorum]QLG89541.1 TolC family outer membrane protein [Chitinibacter bivalviorum]